MPVCNSVEMDLLGRKVCAYRSLSWFRINLLIRYLWRKV
jgi:hypothetical protein